MAIEIIRTNNAAEFVGDSTDASNLATDTKTKDAETGSTFLNTDDGSVYFKTSVGWKAL